MKYPGGKNGGGAYHKIICQMPPHDVYIEPFLGSGAVMFHKRPAHSNIGLDKDAAAVEAFRYRIQGHRFPDLVVKVSCGISFLENYNWQGNELVYCDPPYLIKTRRTRSPIYLHEMSEDDHRRLLMIVQRIPSMVMISGYYSKLYADSLTSWRSVSYKAMTRGGSFRTECLWMNYPKPVELHDYSYLGKNRVDRQRIKRKRESLLSKIEALPPLERQALIAEIKAVECR